MEQSCRAIVDRAHDMVTGMIDHARRDLKLNLDDYTLFAYGGNGGLFACGVAERAGLKDVYLFALGPVFSAFGSSVSDLRHLYERSLRLTLQPGVDVDQLNRTIQEMRATAMRDLKAEGVRSDDAEFSLELEFSTPGEEEVQATTSTLRFNSVDDLRGFVPGNGEAALEVVRLWVRKPMARPPLLERSLSSPECSHACIGEHTVADGGSNGKASVYKWESLQPGNEVAGCALLVSESGTYFVPEGFTLTMDRYGNARIRRDAPRAASRVSEETHSHGG